MRINLIILISLVFYSFSVQAEEFCEDDGCPALKIDNIDLQHTAERLDESLDQKVNSYDPKPKFKNDQKLDLSIKNSKRPSEVKGNSIAEKEQRNKSNEFQKIKSPPGMGNSSSNIKLGIDFDLPNQ